MRSIKPFIESMTLRAVLEYDAELTLRNQGAALYQAVTKDDSPPVIDKPPQELLDTDPNARLRYLKAVLNYLEEADPTTNKIYMRFLIKVYIHDVGPYFGLQDLSYWSKFALTKYHTLKLQNKIPAAYKDILAFASFREFEAFVDAQPDPVESPDKDRGKYREIFNNDQVRVIRPLDETAAKYYGHNTKWCTSGKNDNMFERYDDRGPLYIFLPKKPGYDGEKYQIHFETELYADEQDHEIPLPYLIKGCFGDLRSLFKEINPDLSDRLIMLDWPTLQPILQTIHDLAMPELEYVVGVWEANDPEWAAYLIHNGYVSDDNPDRPDPNKAPEPWLSFDPDYMESYTNAVKAITFASQDSFEWCVDQFADRHGYEEGLMMSVDLIPEIIAYRLFRMRQTGDVQTFDDREHLIDSWLSWISCFIIHSTDTGYRAVPSPQVISPSGIQ